MDKKLLNIEEFGDKSWPQIFLSTTFNITQKTVLDLYNIMIETGPSEINLDERAENFVHELTNLCNNLVSDVKKIRDKIREEIKALGIQIERQCRELNIEVPRFSLEKISLSDSKKLLIQKVSQLESLKETRRNELLNLHLKEMKLCNRLGRTPKLLNLPELPLPSPDERNNLSLYVEELENEAMEREEEFFELREQIFKIVEDFGIAPNLDFERKLLKMGQTDVKISDYYMNQLHLYHEKLRSQSNNIKREINDLRITLSQLWKILKVDKEERKAFLQNNTGYSINVLQSLKTETNRLKDIKKIQIQAIVNRQRKDLEKIWLKCHCSDDDKYQFNNFYRSDCYVEDLVAVHELEIQKWEKYYEENKTIFQVLQEHKKICDALIELDANSESSKGYNNRGAKLLTELKTKNKLSKQMAIVEAQLGGLSAAYQERTGKEFLTFGQTLKQKLEQFNPSRNQQKKITLSNNTSNSRAGANRGQLGAASSKSCSTLWKS